MVIGDYNADIWRGINENQGKTNYNDKKVSEFITRNKITLLDLLYTQPTSNTFKSNDRESWIDHIGIIKSNQHWGLIKQTNIYMDTEERINENYKWDLYNNSDHRPVIVEIDLSEFIAMHPTTTPNLTDIVNRSNPTTKNKIPKRIKWHDKEESFQSYRVNPNVHQPRRVT
jgi:hypothetical protein